MTRRNATAAAEADRILDDPERAHTLPSRYYYDADLFERERETIFYPAWHPVAHKNDVVGPGAFVTLDIFDQSVIVVRGRDDVVRAFHNVFQHRGNRLIEARRGTLGGAIRCPYHSWAYGLDGRLEGAPRSDRVRDFDKADFGLKPVRLEAFAGFLFVNLDTDVIPMSELMAGADAAIRRHCPDLDALTLHSETDFVVDANWKVIVDNAIEGYHFGRSGPVHRAPVDLVVFEAYELKSHGPWWTFMGPSKPGLERAFGEPVDGATFQSDRFFKIQLWPASIFYVFPYADFFGTFLMVPLGPEQTRLHLDYYVPPRPP